MGSRSLRFSFPHSLFPPRPSPPPAPAHIGFLCCCSPPQQHTPPPPSPATTLAAIHSSGVIACLRAHSGEQAIKAAQAALNAGISVLEITMTTPDVFEVLQELVQRYPSSILGVGTVLNGLDAKSATKAGAKFIMSPAMVKDILDDIQGGEILYIPGVMTPTEVLTAYNAGARLLKVYPVSILGGVQYISALKKPFSHIPMVASQGMTLDSMGTYIHGGAAAVVLSDAIFEKEAMNQRNYGRIYELACVAAVQGRELKRKAAIVEEDDSNQEAKKINTPETCHGGSAARDAGRARETECPSIERGNAQVD